MTKHCKNTKRCWTQIKMETESKKKLIQILTKTIIVYHWY